MGNITGTFPELRISKQISTYPFFGACYSKHKVFFFFFFFFALLKLGEFHKWPPSKQFLDSKAETSATANKTNARLMFSKKFVLFSVS